MVNFGLNSASILGIFLAVAGAGLYFLRSVRPELSRDHDIFFAAVGLLCGLILLFQGWRLDPILQFGQFLLTGSAIFFATETIRLRSVTTEQARRTGPIVDDRPVNNAYSYQEAELEALEPYEDDQYGPRGRLRGSDYRGSSRSDYESEAPRPPKSRRPSDPYSGRESRETRTSSRPRRPRPTPPPSYENYDEWDEPSTQRSEQRPPQSPSSRPRRRPPEAQRPETETKPPKKRRPPTSEEGTYSMREPEATSTEYVDYQPIDDQENTSEWDKPPASDRKPKRDDYDDNPNRFDY